MRNDLKAIIAAKPEQLLRDAFGALAICVTFLAALHLPSLF